jgi:hypothetical protein
MKFRIYHTAESKRDPYDVEGVRIEPTSSGYDLILSEERQGSNESRRIREIPGTDIHMIEEDPEEDLAQAIAEYRRLSEVLITNSAPRWRKFASLGQEYKRLHALEGHTPQSRGRRLNGFVVDLLDSWEISAIESASSYGEIDVAFSVDGIPYLMENKWEKDPINFDAISKLNTRVKQRLLGTLGILLSLSGYTDEALRQIARGERLQLILMDASHLDNLVEGSTSPQVLIRALRNRAAFYGYPYVTFSELVTGQKPRVL